MKRPIHLYIFVVLSGIASILRIFSAFINHFDEEAFRQLMTSSGTVVDGVEELITFSREAALFQGNGINKALVVVTVGLLVATIVFLFKKNNQQASYLYIAYLFGVLIFNTYAYIGTRGITAATFGEEVANASIGGYLVNVAIFAIYFGVTVFFLLRKPKETPSVETNSTDI